VQFHADSGILPAGLFVYKEAACATRLFFVLFIKNISPALVPQTEALVLKRELMIVL
jgi:hypothetical protein